MLRLPAIFWILKTDSLNIDFRPGALRQIAGAWNPMTRIPVLGDYSLECGVASHKWR